MRTRAGLRNNERGTSLIEALVAMAVLGIIAGAVLGLFLTGQAAIQSAQGMEQASLLAQQRLEQLKAAAACNSVPLPQSRQPVDPANFPGYTLTVDTVEQSPDLHLVTVTVYWRDARRERDLSLITYIRTEDEEL